MAETWFTSYPDELARLLVDARACAEACEAFLESDPDAIDVLAAPAAVSQILIELIDEPPEVVLAAASLCRDLASAAADAQPELAVPLQRVADSAAALLEAVG